MSRRVAIAYGAGTLELRLPEGARVSVLHKAPVPPLADPAAELERALREPIGGPPLAELARGRRDAVIVVSDRTRPVPNALLLPPILRTLERAGLARERVRIAVATGLHRAATAAELDEILGAELASSLSIWQHDASDAAAHRRLGTSRHGIPIEIDRRYLDADLRIATGLIEPHLMAGYSGGRKAVCPGLASVATIRVAHGPRMLEGPIGPGLLEANPLHEDLTAIARLAGVDFIANVALDRERRVAGVFCGDLERAFEAGAALVERESSVSLDEPADVVLVSGGGDPLDATFYQAIKGIVAAAAVVRPGGIILLCAALSEGVGSPSFQDLLRQSGSREAFEHRLEDPDFFAVDQWMIQHLCQARRRAQVWLYSTGTRIDPRSPLVETVSDPEAALARAARVLGVRRPRVAVLPQGPYVLATIRGQKRPVGHGEPLREAPAPA